MPPVVATPIRASSTPGFISNHLESVTRRPSVTHLDSYSRRPSNSTLASASGFSPLRPISPTTHARAASPVQQMLSTRNMVRSPELVPPRENRDGASGGDGGTRRPVEDALVASKRAREDSERVLAEVLAGIERSFPPNDDKRLVCRAYVVQLGRTAGRLRDAAMCLEREASEALQRASNENTELRGQARHLQLQADGQRRLLMSEVERSETERAAHGDQMHSELERMRHERQSETGRLASDVARLSSSLETSRAETSALWAQSQSQQRVLTAENEKLRAQLAELSAQLEASRDAHGSDASTLRAELILMGAEKTAAVSRMRSDLAYMTKLASETQGELEAKLVMAKVDKEAAVEGLRAELHKVRHDHETDMERMSASYVALEREKEAAETAWRGQLRAAKKEASSEIASLRAKIDRLMATQKVCGRVAVGAGSVAVGAGRVALGAGRVVVGVGSEAERWVRGTRGGVGRLCACVGLGCDTAHGRDMVGWGSFDVLESFPSRSLHTTRYLTRGCLARSPHRRPWTLAPCVRARSSTGTPSRATTTIHP